MDPPVGTVAEEEGAGLCRAGSRAAGSDRGKPNTAVCLLRVHRLLLVVWNLQRLLGEIIRRHYLHRSCLMQVCYNLRLLLMMHVNLMVLKMIVHVMMVLCV